MKVAVLLRSSGIAAEGRGYRITLNNVTQDVDANLLHSPRGLACEHFADQYHCHLRNPGHPQRWVLLEYAKLDSRKPSRRGWRRLGKHPIRWLMW